MDRKGLTVATNEPNQDDAQTERVRSILATMEENEQESQRKSSRTTSTLERSRERISSVFQRTYRTCKPDVVFE